MVAGSGGASALRFLVVVAAASERGEDMVVAGKGGEGSKGRNTDVLWMANAVVACVGFNGEEGMDWEVK